MSGSACDESDKRQNDEGPEEMSQHHIMQIRITKDTVSTRARYTSHKAAPHWRPAPTAVQITGPRTECARETHATGTEAEPRLPVWDTSLQTLDRGRCN